MESVFFELVGNTPIPILPTDGDGQSVVADGVKIFSLEQAAVATGLTPDTLKTIWNSTWGRLMPAEESAVVDASAPAATGLTGAPGVVAARIDLLYRARYGQHDRVHFDYFVEVCKQRKLNPFAQQLEFRIEFDERRQPQIQTVTTIAAFRLIAQRSGKWRGESPPEWCGIDEQWKSIWADDVIPFAARRGVRRSDFPEPIYDPAFWKEHAQYVLKQTGPELSPFWQRMPRLMLAKCASSKSYRIAFPEELGGIYTFDEMPAANSIAAQGPRTEARASADDYTQIQNAPFLEDCQLPEAIAAAGSTMLRDGSPMTPGQFDSALIDLGFGNLERRRMVKEQLRAHLAHIAESNPIRFYAMSVELVRADPRRWGAQAA